MPCTYVESAEERERPAKIEAMLCPVMGAMATLKCTYTVLDKANFGEAGISRKQLLDWWDEHQQKDAERRTGEAGEKKRQAAKASALKKLTAAERKALGL